MQSQFQANKYISIFNNALEKYTHHDENNRGYHLTMFTRLRHSFCYDEKLAKVFQALSQRDNESAIDYIRDYLKSADKNNHSFACYFIDELVKS